MTNGSDGYASVPIDSMTFEIRVEVNVYTDAAVADQYFARRAKEVCAKIGADSWKTLRKDKTSKRAIRWTGILQGETGYRTQLVGLVRCVT
jgi:hypothetical protein